MSEIPKALRIPDRSGFLFSDPQGAADDLYAKLPITVNCLYTPNTQHRSKGLKKLCQFRMRHLDFPKFSNIKESSQSYCKLTACTNVYLSHPDQSSKEKKCKHVNRLGQLRRFTKFSKLLAAQLICPSEFHHQRPAHRAPSRYYGDIWCLYSLPTVYRTPKSNQWLLRLRYLLRRLKLLVIVIMSKYDNLSSGLRPDGILLSPIYFPFPVVFPLFEQRSTGG